jgi:hypothetical protein
MIEVTILSAEAVAQRHTGGGPMQGGGRAAGMVERKMRDAMAKQIQGRLESSDIDATVSRTGSRGLEIEIKDATQAAWQQGIMAWLAAKVVPSSVEHRLASTFRDQFEENGVQAEVNVE